MDDTKLRSALGQMIEERFGLRLSAQQSAQLGELSAQLSVDPSPETRAAHQEVLRGNASPELLDRLVDHLTVGETHFFRIGPQIDALRNVVLPDLCAKRADRRQLHIWSAGCSTGEEPYTLAILLRQHLVDVDQWAVDLLATDVSQAALAAARAASYGDWSFRDTPEEMRTAYFTREGKRWRLAERVRRMVRFTQLNLTCDAYPWMYPDGPRADLIVCRNVTIYFSADTAQRVNARLADALAPGGWLILGPSDPPPQLESIEPIYLPGAVLWRRPETEQRPTAAARPVAAPGLSGARPAQPRQPGPLRAPPPNQSARRSSLLDRIPLPPSSSMTRRPVSRPDRAEPWPKPAPMEPSPDNAAGDGRHAVLEIAERSAGQRPLDPEAHITLGMLLLDGGAFERARESFRRAVFLDERNALAHFGLGLSCQQLQDTERARAALATSAQLLRDCADDGAVPGGNGLQVGELRTAIQARLPHLDARPIPRTR